MDNLFIGLSQALSTSPLIALAAALTWGVLSVALSPCHLASIPLIVGFIDGQGRVGSRRAFVLSSLFAIGILISIALIGIVTALTGRMLGDLGAGANLLVAAIFLLVGLHLLDLLPLPLNGPGQIGLRRKGLPGAFLLGLLFGIALGPCTFAFMAPVLGVSFGVAATRPVYSASLLLAYGIGHCALIVLAGTCGEWVQRFLNWNEHSRGTLAIRKICGLLVIAGGLWLLWTAPF